MDTRTPTFGRSASMPLFQQPNGDQTPDSNGEVVREEQYSALQRSPGFQSFRDQQARVWSPRANGFAGSPRTLSDGIQSIQTAYGSHTGYMTTEGVEVDFEGSPPKVTTATRLTTQPELESAFKKGLSSTANKGNLTTDTLVTEGPPMLPGLYATAGPAAGSSVDQEIRSPVGPFFPSGLNDHAQGFLHAPDGFAHHRRESSRLSSLPSMPSPLGPGHFVDHLGTDYSGLVSPLPSPEFTRRPRKKSTPSPQKLDLHVLKVSANPVGSPYKRKSSVHDRKITDPFVEGSEKPEHSNSHSQSVAQAKQNGGSQSSSQVQVPGVPTAFQFPKSLALQPGPDTPTYDGFDHSSDHPNFHVPGTPLFAPFPPNTPITPIFPPYNPALPASNTILPRTDLPIPPSPLSSVQGRLQHSPSSRARLDARAATRNSWIKTQGANIAALARSTHAATMAYQQSGAQSDLDEWRRLSALYVDATTLSKRQEERRNMFMPRGMVAMKTGIVGDQSVGCASEGEEKEGLLGFKMAYMERVVAEMRIAEEEKEEKEEEGEITLELLDTLSREEKKMLRKHLVDRLEDAAKEREGYMS